MNATYLRRLRSACALAVVVLPLAACSRGTTVSGKVIRGDVSFIGVVDPADPRLKQDGLEGAEVTARGSGTRADRILADTRSGKSGDFSVRIDDQEAIGRPAEFRAHLPAYADARQEMPIPASDRRLLVILKPMAAGAGGGAR
jgi:hypothetical protein